MKTALISGVTGQEGAYLSELLLSKGYVVYGIKRRASSFNTDKPDGTMLKCLDTSLINAMGWTPSISLTNSLKHTYRWATENGVFD